MGTPIAAKNHTSPLTGSEKVPLSPDGYATTDEIAALGTGGGITTVVVVDTDHTVPAGNGVYIVDYAGLSAPRSVNLPSAASASRLVIVRDTDASASDVRTITLVPDGTDGVEGPASVVSSADGATAVFNDGGSHWWNPFSANSVTASLPVLDVDADGNTYAIDRDGTISGTDVALEVAGQITATPGDAASILIVPAADDSKVVIKARSDGNAQFAELSVCRQPGAPSFITAVLDGTEYIDASDTIADGFVLRDGGGGLHLQGTIPSSDPHVVGQVWNSSGTLKISAG